MKNLNLEKVNITKKLIRSRGRPFEFKQWHYVEALPQSFLMGTESRFIILKLIRQIVLIHNKTLPRG
jgi:hypothetical protein